MTTHDQHGHHIDLDPQPPDRLFPIRVRTSCGAEWHTASEDAARGELAGHCVVCRQHDDGTAIVVRDGAEVALPVVAIAQHNRPDGHRCRWSGCRTVELHGFCPDRCQVRSILAERYGPAVDVTGEMVDAVVDGLCPVCRCMEIHPTGGYPLHERTCPLPAVGLAASRIRGT